MGVSALVIAADLSLGGTGLARFLYPPDLDPWQLSVWTVKAPPRDRSGEQIPMPVRHGTILAPIFGLLDHYRTLPRLVVKEERLTPARNREPHSSSTGQDLAGLHAVCEYGLYRRGVTWVDVPGTTLKKYATGRHQAAKEDVRAAAVRRLEHLHECADNNQSDALWLLVMALQAYGLQLADLPVAQQIAADKISWPAVAGLDLKGVADGIGQHLRTVPQG